jgi:predicted outer membrane repeat protein
MRQLLLSISLLLFASSTSSAETYVVRPDGTGDFPTIQAGLDAVAPGDVIDLAAGSYTGDGNRDLDFLGKDVIVRSQTGDPASCVLDGGGSETDPHRVFHFRSGETERALLQGIRITGGWNDTPPHGGGVLLQGASSPTFRFCLFEENYGSAVFCSTGCVPHFQDCEFRNNVGLKGGGIYSVAARPVVNRCSFFGNSSSLSGGAIMAHAGSVTLDDCVFEGNVAGEWGGALQLLFGTQGQVSNCRFLNNSAEEAGAIFNFYADLVLDGCTFIGNTANADGGAFASGKVSTTIMRNCTFYRNGARWGALMCGESWTRLENTIIAFGAEGKAIQVAGTATLVCCDLYGNPGGDWTTGIEDQLGINGNIRRDPLFCDMANDNCTLDAASPCAPANSGGCGLIGAVPVACSATAVELTTWGAIKASFR